MRLPAYGAMRHTAADMLSCVQFGGAANIAWPTGVIGGNSAGWAWAGWFWPISLGTARDICYAATADTPRFGYSSTGLIQFARSGQALISAGTPYPAQRRWIHGAVSVTPLAGNVGYDWVIYQFGEVVASGREVSGAFIAHTVAPTAVLGSGGRMGRQTIWQRAITQAEARAHFYEDRASGAAADWRLDEGEGTSCLNSVSGGSPLTLTNCTYITDTPKWATQVAQSFGSVLLPGVDGSHLSTVAGAVLPQLVGATGITLVSWHRPRMALGGTQGSLITGRSGTSPGAVHLLLAGFNRSQTAQARIAFTDTLQSASGAAFTAEPVAGRGRWRMTAASFDVAGDMIRHYNQGLQYSRTAVAFNGGAFSIGSPPPDDFTSLYFGEDVGSSGAHLAYTGWLGPQRIYDRVLTNAQVRDVYLKGSTSVQPAFEWLFNEASGATAATSSNSKFAAPATLVGSAAWSLDQPW